VLEEAFRLFDKDGDGNITSTELQSVMESLGQPVHIRQAFDMIMSVDKDGKTIRCRCDPAVTHFLLPRAPFIAVTFIVFNPLTSTVAIWVQL